MLTNDEEKIDDNRTILTEIDENEFFYEEPSPYAAAVAQHALLSPQMEETNMSSYTIDEFIDEEEEEEDHVKILEETIANLSRHLPSTSEEFEQTEMNVPSIKPVDDSSVNPMPTINLSRSSGIRENLTDLLSSITTPSLQRTSSIHDKVKIHCRR